MINKYYKSSSNNEELFGISNENNTKMFIINKNGYLKTLNINKLIYSKMREIEEYEYSFNNEIKQYLIKKIKFYIQNADMTYRKKTLIKLKKDLKELESKEEGE